MVNARALAPVNTRSQISDLMIPAARAPGAVTRKGMTGSVSFGRFGDLRHGLTPVADSLFPDLRN